MIFHQHGHHTLKSKVFCEMNVNHLDYMKLTFRQVFDNKCWAHVCMSEIHDFGKVVDHDRLLCQLLFDFFIRADLYNCDKNFEM